MNEFLTFTIIGIVTGAAYAVAASGLVVTYATSGIFNIAHGAIGMFMAFFYWQLVVQWHVPPAVALVTVVLLAAPAFGAAVELILIRRVRGNSLATTLVVTIGFMVFLIGLVNTVWKPTARIFPPFFGHAGYHLGPVFVTWHETITVFVAVGIAIGLRLLLYRTRVGIAMRAVVDNRELAALNGARPAWVGTLSWALGASLASLAGILIAPTLQLSVLPLTLLVVNAYAAAMVGRLRSLPFTFLGALIIGLSTSYAVGYMPSTGFWGRRRCRDCGCPSPPCCCSWCCSGSRRTRSRAGASPCGASRSRSRASVARSAAGRYWSSPLSPSRASCRRATSCTSGSVWPPR
jgi:branched-chain amino acid transport system permease protein